MYLRVWSSSLVYLCLRFPIVTLMVVGLCIAVPSVFWQREGETCNSVCCPLTMVTLTFDDGYKSVISNAFPLMEKYGYKGTVYIITSKVGQPGYMDWNDLRFLQENGWEIASHSVTHPHLTEISDTQLQYELAASKSVLESQGLVVRNFASPYGEYDNRVLEAVAQYYDSHRTAWPADLNFLPLINPENRWRLKAVEADHLSVAEVKEWIDLAVDTNKWLILLFHRIGEEGEYNYSLQDFEEILRYLSEKSFQQVLPDFILNQDFTCADLFPAQEELHLLFSPSVLEDGRTCLLFDLQWEGKGELCFASFEIKIYNEDGRIVVDNRIPGPLNFSQGANCFQILARPLQEGNYTTVVFLEDCNGLSWQASFSFFLGAECEQEACTNAQ